MIMFSGDLKPDLKITLSSDDGVTITDAVSIRIIGRRKRGGVIVFDRAPTTQTVNAGATPSSTLTMEWQAGDTAVVGQIAVEVEVTWPGGKPQTFRADTYVTVKDDLDL